MQSSAIYCDTCGAANRLQARFCIACGHAMPFASFSGQATPLVSSTPPTELAGSPPGSASLTGRLPAHSLLKQRYLILVRLGQGGMGAVYQAADIQLGDRLVAVKEMSQKGLDPQEIAHAAAAFKREAYLLASLPHHPHLPSVYDYFDDGSRWYLVMDFIAGETLEQYGDKAGGQLLPGEVLDIGIQLSAVLDFLHRHQSPIIFRDLKPANVMRTPEGDLFLIDFGIARHFRFGQAKDTIAYGSAGYAAPEQYGKAQSTPQSDIYSLGATLHHLLTGIDPALFPFRFAPLSGAGISADLSTLIARMVEIDREKRPASMAEVKQQLQYLLAQSTGSQLPSTIHIGEGDDPSIQMMVSAPSRSSSPSLGTVLCTYRGHSNNVRAVAWSPDSTRIASASNDSSVQVWEATNGRKHLALSSTISDAMAWSPDGTRIASGYARLVVWDADKGGEILHIKDGVDALAWSPDSRYVVHSNRFHKNALFIRKGAIFVRNTATGKKRLTYRAHGKKGVYTLAWSPDGKHIASGSDDGTVQIRNAATGHLLLTYRGHSSYIRSVAWSPDGKRIASGSWDKTVQVWDAATGCLLLTYRDHDEYVNTVAWSPDGTRLVSGSDDKTARIWDGTTGRTLLIYRGHSEYVNTVAWSPDGMWIASGGGNTRGPGDDHTVQVWQAS